MKTRATLKDMKIKRLIVGPLLTNCYILISKNEAALIDPGGGTKKILKEIESAKASLKYIILTHSHIDHTFSVLKIKEKTKAQILIHEDEKDFIFRAKREKQGPRAEREVLIKFKVDRFLKDEEKIKIGEILLEVIHTPGHTKGGICLKGDNFIFTGDTLFEDGYGRVDLPGGSQRDLEKSLKRLSKFFKKDTIVYPGHGEVFKII